MSRNKRRRKRSNRTGSWYQRDGRFIIQWYGASGKRHSASFGDQLTAVTELSVRTGEAAQGREGIAEVDAGAAETLAEHAKKWLADRKNKRSWYQDDNRWTNHWLPLVGHLKPDQVTVAVLKDQLRTLRKKGLSNSTIKLCVALLSSLYSDLVEDGVAKLNVTRILSRKTRAEYLKSKHDPRSVPFVQDPSDILRIYHLLEAVTHSVGVAYALGSMAGLRTGEVRALSWENVDLERKTISVSHSVECRRGRGAEEVSKDGLVATKSGVIRVVPIFDSLLPILRGAWASAGGVGLVCPTDGRGRTFQGRLQFLDDHTMAKKLGVVLTTLGLPKMTWYEATRHTFASQWVLHDGNIHKLSEMMGHTTTAVTERHYIHLAPGRYTDADRGRVRLEAPAPVTVPTPAAESQTQEGVTPLN